MASRSRSHSRAILCLAAIVAVLFSLAPLHAALSGDNDDAALGERGSNDNAQSYVTTTPTAQDDAGHNPFARLLSETMSEIRHSSAMWRRRETLSPEERAAMVYKLAAEKQSAGLSAWFNAESQARSLNGNAASDNQQGATQTHQQQEGDQTKMMWSSFDDAESLALPPLSDLRELAESVDEFPPSSYFGAGMPPTETAAESEPNVNLGGGKGRYVWGGRSGLDAEFVEDDRPSSTATGAATATITSATASLSFHSSSSSSSSESSSSTSSSSGIRSDLRADPAAAQSQTKQHGLSGEVGADAMGDHDGVESLLSANYQGEEEDEDETAEVDGINFEEINSELQQESDSVHLEKRDEPPASKRKKSGKKSSKKKGHGKKKPTTVATDEIIPKTDDGRSDPVPVDLSSEEAISKANHDSNYSDPTPSASVNPTKPSSSSSSSSSSGSSASSDDDVDPVRVDLASSSPGHHSLLGGTRNRGPAVVVAASFSPSPTVLSSAGNVKDDSPTRSPHPTSTPDISASINGDVHDENDVMSSPKAEIGDIAASSAPSTPTMQTTSSPSPPAPKLTATPVLTANNATTSGNSTAGGFNAVLDQSNSTSNNASATETGNGKDDDDTYKTVYCADNQIIMWSTDVENIEKCTFIRGNLFLVPAPFDPDKEPWILRLPKLREIGENLVITGTTSVLQLDLPNLERVGAFIVMKRGNLTDLSFPKLTSTSGIEITENQNLKQLQANSLEALLGGLQISDNPHISSVALRNLVHVEDGIGIRNNARLREILFPNLEDVVGGIRIENMPLLDKMEIGVLSSVAFPEDLESSLAAANLHASGIGVVSGASSPIGSVVGAGASDENSGNNIVGSSGGSAVGSGGEKDYGFYLSEVPRLEALSLNGLRYVSGPFYVGSATILQDLFVPSLIFVGGSVTLENIPALEESRFPSLVDVSRSFLVRQNPSMQLLSLPALEYIGFLFQITDNLDLQNVTAPSLTYVTGHLDISNNPRLLGINMVKLHTVSGDFRLRENNLTHISLPSIASIDGDGVVSQSQSTAFTCDPNVATMKEAGVAKKGWELRGNFQCSVVAAISSAGGSLRGRTAPGLVSATALVAAAAAAAATSFLLA